MIKFHLEGTAKTPLIDFNGETGILELKGRSIPENSVEFFQPITAWLDDYEAAPKAEAEEIKKKAAEKPSPTPNAN